MARPYRTISGLGVSHVMLRGAEGRLIFQEPADYKRFLFDLAEVRKCFGFKLLGYCLMDNHVHLLIQDTLGSLLQICALLSLRYTNWFNRKYDRCGYLFQDQFKSEAVVTDSYLLVVLLYLYMNPVKAGICDLPQEYRWSSRRMLGAGALCDEAALFSIAPLESILARELREIRERWRLEKPQQVASVENVKIFCSHDTKYDTIYRQAM